MNICLISSLLPAKVNDLKERESTFVTRSKPKRTIPPLFVLLPAGYPKSNLIWSL